MSDNMTQYNAAQLLVHLGDKGFITDQELSDFIISQQQDKELPLYLRVLVGIGAFISSLCFIAFLYQGYIIDFDDGATLLVCGLIFVAGAIKLQRVAEHNNTVKHSFLMQLSFAWIAIGKTLFLLGMSKILNSEWGVTLGLFMITSITYPIYRMSIDRFLSSFAVLLSILVNILWDEDMNSSKEWLLNGFFLLQFMVVSILLTHGKIKRDYIPLSYAFVFSLCANVLFLASQGELGYWEDKDLIYPSFINMVLMGGLIALLGWAAGGIEKFKTQPLVLACIGAAFLGFISAPGILLTTGLMVLGYARHEKLLIIIGALLMPVFLFLYYDNLDISLLKKSGVLIGSGLVLLAGRFYLKYKGWDEGHESCVQR